MQRCVDVVCFIGDSCSEISTGQEGKKIDEETGECLA